MSGLGSGVCCAQIVASVPGRLRIRVPVIKQNRELLGQIVAVISEEIATVSVSSSGLTGTIVIRYEPDIGDQLDYVRTIFGRFGIELEDCLDGSESPTKGVTAPKARPGTLARFLLSGGERSAHVATGGLGLRTALPAGLGALALYQLHRGPKLRDAPWYVTAWYAYTLFDRFNSGAQRSSDKHLTDESSTPVCRCCQGRQ